MLLLGLYHFLMFWIDGLTGHGYHGLGALAAGAVGRAAVAGGRGAGRLAHAPLVLSARAPWHATRGSRTTTPSSACSARRVVAASIVIMVLLGALFARLFYLQVVRHDYFSELSQGNRIRIEPIPPPAA